MKPYGGRGGDQAGRPLALDHLGGEALPGFLDCLVAKATLGQERLIKYEPNSESCPPPRRSRACGASGAHSELATAFSDIAVSRPGIACDGNNRSVVSTMKLLPPALGPLTATETGRSSNREVTARSPAWRSGARRPFRAASSSSSRRSRIEGDRARSAHVFHALRPLLGGFLLLDRTPRQRAEHRGSPPQLEGCFVLEVKR